MKVEKSIRVGIMQPYFLPYLGYFQLIQKCDVFVLYDDIQFTKKGWISRNYLGSESSLPWAVSIPTLAAKTETLIRDKVIAPEYKPQSIMARVDNNYQNGVRIRKSERELLHSILDNSEKNLFQFLKHSIVKTAKFLDLNNTQFVISSDIGDFTHLKSESKVLAILSELKAKSYLNPVSGQHLYDSEHFLSAGIKLEFFDPFIPSSSKFDDQPLSIFHALMTQGSEKTIQEVSLGGVHDDLSI